MAEHVYVHANTGQVIKRVNKLRAARVVSDPILTYTQAPFFAGTISGSSLNYNFNISQATSSFHHANSFRDHFAAYPFSHTGLNFKQDIEITNSLDHDGYSNGNKIGFGQRNYHYWAHSSDIVFHEMGHSLTYSIYGGWIGNPETEGAAMDEGFSDYLATSLNFDPQFGTGVGISNRNLSTVLSYDTDYIDLDSGHLNGRIIGGAMWELQGEIGVTTAQHLWYKAMHVEPQAHTFEDFLYNLYVADYQNYAAANWDDIEDAFESRDIITTRPAMGVVISGPSAILENSYHAWTTSVSFNPTSVSYEWFSRPLYSTDPWTSLSVYTSSLYTSFSQSVELLVEITSGSAGADFEHFVTVEEDCSTVICLSPSDTHNPEFVEQPVEFALIGNFPNPFNPSTQIAFSLAVDSPVKLSVFDITGRLVQVLVKKTWQKVNTPLAGQLRMLQVVSISIG